MSGQVKINCVLKGETIKDIQYVPISDSIPFNYNSPQDVLNYTHGENVRMLYSKISEVFYSSVGRSDLSVSRLHRYTDGADDTHDGTYEMGMKRLSYERYQKQFAFFCPIWCDSKTDFNTLKFELCFAHAKTEKVDNPRVIYRKYLEFDGRTKKLLSTFFEEEDNTRIVYLGFDKMESYTKGMSVKTGKIETVDTSFIMNNLIYQERPVLETDNMIASLFSQKKIIAPQIINFNFVFNPEDILPINILSNLIGERINIFVNVYYGEPCKQAQIKDFYSNYEVIPRYNISTGEYLEEYKGESLNVLNYLKDNKAISLIDKNKLVQSTFHWALQSNKDCVFNLYSGFAPVYINDEDQIISSNKIAFNETDIFTDKYDLIKNPFGLFKYTDLSKIGSNTMQIVNTLLEDTTYYTLDLTDNKNSDAYRFGNILLDSIKMESFKDNLRNSGTNKAYNNKKCK